MRVLSNKFLIRVSLCLVSLVLFSCSGDKKAKDLDGIEVKTVTGRFYDAFDGNLPSIDNAAHWYLGNSILDLDNSKEVIPPGGKLVEGSFKNEDSTEFMLFSKFGPAEDEEAYKAKGSFYEIPLYFSNNSNDTNTLTLSKEENKTLNVQLVLENKEIFSPVAFRIPGFFPIDERSLFTSFEGKLSLSLPPKNQTWLLLIFDIPEDIKTANLALCSKADFDINFSAAKFREINCKTVQEYKTELQFSMTQNWKKGEDPANATTTYYTNRETILDILNRFELEGETKLNRRLKDLIEMIKKAPAYEATYPQNPWFDVTISPELFSELSKLTDDIAAQFNCEK
jgi:hypothetical protein